MISTKCHKMISFFKILDIYFTKGIFAYLEIYKSYKKVPKNKLFQKTINYVLFNM